MKTALPGAALLAMTLAACATAPATGPTEIADPYEGFNRKMFAFNNGLDKYALSPAATAYKTVTPEFARDRVADFFSNLKNPVIFANDVLQGEGNRAGTTFARFGINTTVGVLGLWDAASHMGIDGHREDFGQTLAVWGVESGPYLVMPFLGPTTPRDLVGFGVDRAIDPLSYVQYDDDWDTDLAIRGGMNVVNGLNIRVRFDDQIDALNAQPEPYIALRRIYSSSRQAEILNGKVDEATAYDDLPDFDAFDDYDDEVQENEEGVGAAPEEGVSQ
ncbi:VacJ family lipoprotein [Hyphomonas sp. WL0036]|uniref:MlaA family lipoprotein n=1 Tax=Hyphomonas sediminis TaxID=2866160 RepID=UPI001C7F7F44|nr:VacJ family lipoprotein [Hyphomonas sediminis]MBY9067918.1 VacJ family lipoprotein [Hyphomonas sediminis]